MFSMLCCSLKTYNQTLEYMLSWLSFKLCFYALSLSFMVFWIRCSLWLRLFHIFASLSSSSCICFFLISQDCGLPTCPGNGTIELTDAGTTTYGATATQTCYIGFDLTGVANITCGADGNWSSPAVTCIIKGNLYIVGFYFLRMYTSKSYKSDISL